MIDIKKLQYVKNAPLERLVEFGFQEMQTYGVDGFDYTIGKVFGGEIKLVFKPHCQPGSSIDSVVIDGVDGFGLCGVYEDEDKAQVDLKGEE